MQVRAVDFIGVGVPDVEKASGFYGGTLGLTVTADSEGWTEYDAGNVTIAVFKVPEEEIGSVGYRNAVVALAVPDVEAALAELRQKGVRVAEDMSEYTPCFMATVEDPFGNLVMLHQRKDGTAG